MKLQDLLVPLTMAFLVTWGIQYFFVTRNLTKSENTAIHAGQSFKVLSAENMVRPINTDVDFVDQQLSVSPQQSEIATPLTHYRVTTGGGAVDAMAFVHKVDHTQEWLSTVSPQQDSISRDKAWLIGLEKVTPYAYRIAENKHEGDLTFLTVVGESQDARITKEFIFYDSSNKIDLALTVEPLHNSAVQPRIFLPGPIFPLEKPETVMGIVFTDKESVQKYKVADLEHNVWAAPTLFGTENRYFVHALIKDDNQFTERAYYKIEGQDLTAIFEGPLISEKTTWKLSFYCGPKRVQNLSAVDVRLEETLDYGWFAPISKLLLTLLNFIYSYVHNYGWAIIILTLFLRLIMVPFTLRNEQGAEKRSEMARKMKYLEQKYKNDREALAREKMELIRKYGVVPDAAGCLPNLLYIPVFIGLNRLLNNSIDLYHAPFIKGWINDLSLRDPYYILPGLIALGLILQSNSGDPRQRVALFMMALVVAGVTAQLSAGLVLFITVSTLSTVLQTYVQRTFMRNKNVA